MKKLFLLTIILILTNFQNVSAMAPTAFSACVMNAATGEVIWEKNGYEQHPMASTTKIMTAIVALEESGSDEVVKVSNTAALTEGSSMYLHGGDEFVMRDLLYGLMLNSGNDAAMAIAEHMSQSVEGFAELMNKKAIEIGVTDTKFQNPSGLDADGHYTTACDLALITKYASQNPEFCDIVLTRYTEVRPCNNNRLMPLANHNKLLAEYEGCIGVKTGYTKSTGRCLVSAATRDGMTFIAVTLDDPDDWKNHKTMLDYCFENYRPVEVVSEGETVKNVVVEGKTCDFVYEKSLTIPVKINEKADIEVKNHIVPTLVGGINKGEKVGEGGIYYKGEKLSDINIVSAQEIPPAQAFRVRRSFWGVFNIMLKNFLF